MGTESKRDTVTPEDRVRSSRIQAYSDVFGKFGFMVSAVLLVTCGTTNSQQDASGMQDVASVDAVDVPRSEPIDGGEVLCSSDGWCRELGSPDQGSIYSISGTSATDVWAVGDRGILHWDGSRWLRYTVPGYDEALVSVFAAAPDDAWAVGRNGVAHWDGSAWADRSAALRMPGEVLPLPPCWLVWGSSAHNVWISCEGLLRQWDGQRWSDRRTNQVGTRFVSIVGDANGPHFGLELMNRLLRWNGTEWMLVSSPDGRFEGLAGTRENDVWMVGEGNPWHWDGSAWAEVPRPSGFTLHAAFAHTANDVWAVGDDGRILHWDGMQWSASTSGFDGRFEVQFLSIWGSTNGDLWVGGTQGTILHRRAR